MNQSYDLNLLRLRYVLVLAVGTIVLSALSFIPVFISQRGYILPLVLFIALNGIWFWLANNNQLRPATYGMMVTFVLASLVVPFEIFLLPATLALVTAAMVANNRLYVLANVLILGRLALSAIQLVQQNLGTIPPELNDYILPLLALSFVTIAVRYFINVGQEIILGSRTSAELLQATSDVGQVLSQILDLEDMLARAVELIAARFNHYHVQIFMVSEGRDHAVLVASTGEVGKTLISRGHQLTVGSQSVIGQVVLRSAPVLVSDTRHESIYYANDLLQQTRAELALPIREGNLTIGALDIQSLQPNAFSKADLQALQIMADLLATAIRNARLFRQQSETMQENERLYRDAEANLREIQRLNQQLTRSAWLEYQNDSRAATGVTLENDRLYAESAWSAPLIRAGQQGQVVTNEDKLSGGTVAVPMILRGEVIGAIEVEAGTENNPETVEMVQAVAQRLALSLENARLYEATLEAAAQEQRINDIAARFQSVVTVDELLRITLAELSDTLGAEAGAIRLGSFAGGNPASENGHSQHD